MPFQDDKKLSVLHQLSQESDPIGLIELLEKLGEGYIERTVRRWLTEMIENGLVEKSGNKRGTKYLVIQRADRKSDSNCFSSESLKAIDRVRRPVYERDLTSYNDSWFEAYRPNDTFYIPLNIRTQLHKAGKRSKVDDPAGTYAHQIFNRLLIDLSYNSSRLEGNTYSLLDTEKLIVEGISAEGKLEEEKVMILNHKEAIRYLVDSAPSLKISKETIFTLHYLLSDGLIPTAYNGKIRDHGVRISGSSYVPFDDPKQLLFRMERIVEKASLIQDPFEQSLFLLIHVSYLQAFADVNKRTARLSANISLIKHNFAPLSFNDVKREDYNSAMIAVYELQDVHAILDVYTFSYMRTCAAYGSTIKTVGFDEIRVRYRQQRRAIIREIIVNKIVGEPLKKYITAQTQNLIRRDEQADFLQDIEEDLKYIDISRISGLGITPEQLNEWKAAAHISFD